MASIAQTQTAATHDYSTPPALQAPFQINIPKRMGQDLVLINDFKTVYTDNPSDDLVKTLGVAAKINAYVLETIHYSGSYPNRLHICPYSNEEMFDIVEGIREQRPERAQKMMKKYKTANCYEMAEYALTYPHASEIRLEMFENAAGDHAALVLNRMKNSPLNDIDRWGPDAVIACPWSNSYYPASLYRDHFYDYKKNIPVFKDGRTNPYAPVVSRPEKLKVEMV